MPFPSKRLTNSERIFIQKYSIKLRKEKDSFISHAHRDRLQILERAFSFISKKVKSFFVQKGDRYKKKERKLHAVITVEATLTIPLFFLAGVMLIYSLEVQATRISVKIGSRYSGKKGGGADLSCSSATSIKSRVRYCRSNWAETVKPKYDCW